MMYHEAELPSVMIGGFVAISVIFVVAIIIIFLSTKNWKALLAFAGQWYMTYEAFQCIYNVVSGRNIHAGMASEDNSWYIGLCGLFWGGQYPAYAAGDLFSRQANQCTER